MLRILTVLFGVFASSLSALTLFLPSRGVAGFLGEYIPPPPQNQESVAQIRTHGGGSRGCDRSMPPKSLTMIVPQDGIAHQTTMSRPQFFVAIDTIPQGNLQFTLIEPGVAKPLVDRKMAVNRRGIWQIELPKEVSLETGKIYLWNLVFFCADGGEQSAEQLVRAAVKRVPISPQLSQKLEQTSQLEEKAQTFAMEGIWYDALLFAKQSHSTNYWQQLLNGVNLNHLEHKSFVMVKL